MAKKYKSYLVFILLFTSCIKDKPQEPQTNSVTINKDASVLVINEGPFVSGGSLSGGSISLYDGTTGAVIEDYYKQQNNGAVLGNIVQSVTKYNSNYYIVNNNSNNITVVNATNFVKTGLISGLNSPRFILPITYNKAYVSDLKENRIAIVDLNTNTIIGNIPCMKNTEEMALIYSKAFVTNYTSAYCYVINTTNNVLTDSLNIGVGASSVVVDKNAKVWILSNGNSIQTGKLTRINPITLQVEMSLSFNTTDSPSRLCINKTRDTLYYLNKGVCQTTIINNVLPSSVLINQGTKVFYGLGINPKNYSIYVSDAIDYTQKSKIEIYSTQGNFKTNFNAGVIANGFVFE